MKVSKQKGPYSEREKIELIHVLCPLLALSFVNSIIVDQVL